jgi:hypothetical protein
VRAGQDAGSAHEGGEGSGTPGDEAHEERQCAAKDLAVPTAQPRGDRLDRQPHRGRALRVVGGQRDDRRHAGFVTLPVAMARDARWLPSERARWPDASRRGRQLVTLSTNWR